MRRPIRRARDLLTHEPDGAKEAARAVSAGKRHRLHGDDLGDCRSATMDRGVPCVLRGAPRGCDARMEHADNRYVGRLVGRASGPVRQRAVIAPWPTCHRQVVFLLSALVNALFGFAAMLPYGAVVALAMAAGFVVQGNFPISPGAHSRSLTPGCAVQHCSANDAQMGLSYGKCPII